jgi:LuxR family transcriptional regulator, maltose regulon positive regulatory protein
VLERLAREGHLEVREGAIAYALRQRDRLALSDPPPETADEDGQVGATPVECLEEPSSGRERAVLGLLADGFTNREIAQRLFIAQGSVKAHVASVYRKLDVHSRAGAVSRARDLHLLQ